MKGQPNRPNPGSLQRKCDAWNAANPIGTIVKYHPVIGNPEYRVRKTRTAAQLLSGHTPVLWLEGESGCVALQACIAIPQGTPIEIKPGDVLPITVRPGDSLTLELISAEPVKKSPGLFLVQLQQVVRQTPNDCLDRRLMFGDFTVTIVRKPTV